MVRLRWSIAARLTFGLGLAALLVFVAAAAVLQHALASDLDAAYRAEVAGKTAVVLHFVEEASRSADRSALSHHLQDLRLGHRGLYIWITAADGTQVYGSGVPGTDAGQGEVAPAVSSAAYLQESTLPPTSPWPGGRLLVGLDKAPRDELLSAHLASIVLVCSVGLAITVLLSWVAIRHGLRIVSHLSAEARSITPERPGKRLTEPPPEVELNGLIRTFNSVLDRLERAHEQLEAFNANVAHELRTPLAAMITGAHVTLSAPRSSEDLRSALASNLEELEQLNGLVNDMLFLARADRGDRAEGLATVSLGVEADKAIHSCETLLDDARVSAERAGDASASCNPALIRRALVNLLTNAIRHTAAGSTVKVRVLATAEEARVQVENPGAVIPEDVCKHMFDRFYRADPSRSRTADGGYGLGLAIVAGIARMHGGRVFVERCGSCNAIGFTLPVGSGLVAASSPDAPTTMRTARPV